MTSDGTIQSIKNALSAFDFGINRSALAPVPAAETGANALRLISPSQILNVDRATLVVPASTFSD